MNMRNFLTVLAVITASGSTALAQSPEQTQPAPAAAVAAPAAPAIATELTTGSLATAIREFGAAASNPYAGKAFATYGEFVTSDGRTFVPVMLYVPSSAALASENLTFFGVVQDASGTSVAAFEQPATLTASKEDQFVDLTLPALPAGKYRGIFGLAENGAPVVLASTDMELAGSLDKDAAGASRLILSNNLYALPVAQAPDDPFAFGGMKVVPKADRTFTQKDDMWYFVELRNPGIPEPAATDPVPVSGDVPPPSPKIQMKIDVTGAKKFSDPLRAIDAVAVKGVPGHYAVGNSIPLSVFPPGEYTMTLKIVDTVKKESFTVSDTFKVVP